MSFLSNLNDTDSMTTKGYEWMADEPDEDELVDDTKFEQGTTPSGSYLPSSVSELNSLTYDQFNQVVFGDDEHIFGLPYKYTPLADPLMRVYENTFEADASVVYIQFGTSKINRSLYRKLSIEQETGVPAAFSSFTGLISSMSSGSDTRLVSFKPDFYTFYKSASVVANYLWMMLDLPGSFDWDEHMGSQFNKAGVPFYTISKQTNISEGISNQYNASEITEKANQQAAEQRQNYQLTGTYGTVSKGQDFTSVITNKIAEGASQLVADMPIIGSIASIFMKTNKGSMQFYGDLWGNSEGDNSCSLSFKFSTPYGNKLDIFRNIYFPFSLLYTAAHPRQDGRWAYMEPFLIKIQYPG